MNLRLIIQLVIFLAASIHLPGQNTIEINRQSYGHDCVIGKLFINGSFVAYTAELPYLENFQDISSIPVGVYSGFIKKDGIKGFRIELSHVQGRNYIQIHMGNYVSKRNPATNDFDTYGCILPGLEIDEDSCMPRNSKRAMQNIELLLLLQEYQNHFCNHFITVVIRDICNE